MLKAIFDKYIILIIIIVRYRAHSHTIQGRHSRKGHGYKSQPQNTSKSVI